MKCPICNTNCLEENDSELICEHCGSAFSLEYEGMYEEGGDELICDGEQSSAYMSEWGTKLNKFKGYIN